MCIHVHISVSMMGGGLSTDRLPLLFVPSYLLSNIPSASKDILKFCSDSHLSQAGGSGREDEVGKLLNRSLSGSTLFIYPSEVLDKRQVWNQARATWDCNGFILQSKCHWSNSYSLSQSCNHVMWKSQHSYFAERKHMHSLFTKSKNVYIETTNVKTFELFVNKFFFNFLFYLTALQMKTLSTILLPLNSAKTACCSIHADSRSNLNRQEGARGKEGESTTGN